VEGIKGSKEKVRKEKACLRQGRNQWEWDGDRGKKRKKKKKKEKKGKAL